MSNKGYHKSRLSSEQNEQYQSFESQLALLIKTLINLNKQLERHKKDLFQNHMFSPFVAFQYLDVFGQGYITKSDFFALLKKNDIEASGKEVQYLMFEKAKKNTFNVDFSLTRPDIIFYEDFLKIISPKDEDLLKNKFCDLAGKYEGKERLLPSYVYDHLMYVIKLEVEKFRKIENMKSKLIEKYGYFANDAFYLILHGQSTGFKYNRGNTKHGAYGKFENNEGSGKYEHLEKIERYENSGQSQSIDFACLSKFMNSNDMRITQSEYKDLLRDFDCDFDEKIDKSEFLDLLTPFNSYLTSYVGDRRYENLAKFKNDDHFKRYLDNGYGQNRGRNGKTAPINPKHKIVPELLKGIYTKHFKDPQHPTNKNLYLDDRLKVNFDLRKKKFNATSTRGFNDYYNDYFKHLCHEERQEAVGLARRIVEKNFPERRLKETHFDQNEKKKGWLLDRFKRDNLARKDLDGNSLHRKFNNIVGLEKDDKKKVEKALEFLVKKNFNKAGNFGKVDFENEIDPGSGFFSHNLEDSSSKE